MGHGPQPRYREARRRKKYELTEAVLLMETWCRPVKPLRETPMTASQTLAFPQENLVGWERAMYAFLVEKQRRSGSDRTVQSRVKTG